MTTATATVPIAPQLLPLTAKPKRINWFKLPENQPIPATLEKFIELTRSSKQRLEFHEGQIIAMGEATVTHEKLTGNILTRLNLAFGENPTIHVMGSNVKTFYPGQETACFYNADVVAVRGEPRLVEVQIGKRAQRGLGNPWLVVEVLSEGTEKKDLTLKIPNYKQIKSVQHILIADHRKVWVSLLSRIPGTEKWINEDFYKLSDLLQIEEQAFQVSDFYLKMALEADGRTVREPEIDRL